MCETFRGKFNAAQQTFLILNYTDILPVIMYVNFAGSIFTLPKLRLSAYKYKCLVFILVSVFVLV